MRIQLGRGSAAFYGCYRWKGGWRGFGEPQRKEFHSSPWYLFDREHWEGCGDPQTCLCSHVSELLSPQITIYSVFFLQQILLVWGGYEEEEAGKGQEQTISAEGKEGIEGTELKRKALESKDFCSYNWDQKSLLPRTSALTVMPAPVAFRDSSGWAGRNPVWTVCLDVCVWSRTLSRVPVSQVGGAVTTGTCSYSSHGSQVEF